MTAKPTYEELEARVADLKLKLDRAKGKDRGVIRALSEDFQRLADRSQDAIYRLDLGSQTFPFFNRRFLDLFGVEDGKTRILTPKGSMICIHPEDQESLKQERAKSLEKGSTGGENEYRHMDKDGSIRWMHDKWTVIRDPEGSPLAIEGFIRDNTRRKQAEDELDKSRKNALIGSYIVQNGRFIYVNNEFCRITKYDKSELIGSLSLNYVHKKYINHVKSSSLQMLKGQRLAPYEFCIVAKTGEIRWVMETVTSVLHEGRRAILAYFMDITTAKHAEKERREKEKLQAILELAGAVSHELNNPLQVILLCSANLERHVQDIPEGRKKIRMLNDNTKKMAQIINKFHKITQYATKDYIQGKKILDIDAAAGE